MDQIKIIKNSVDSITSNLKDFDSKTEGEQIHSSCVVIIDLIVICTQVDSIIKDMKHFTRLFTRDIPVRKPMLLLPEHIE